MKAFNIVLVTLAFPLLCFGQNYYIGEQTISFTDTSRNRPIKAEVWYPTLETDSSLDRKTELPFQLLPTIRGAKFIDKSFPLIFISHGTGGNRFSLAWLATELAKNGYIVVAPDHWGNTYDNKIPEYFIRYWERPLDISFLLSAILNDQTFEPYIDKEKIGMIGFSLGAYTTLAIGGVQVECELFKETAKTKEGEQQFIVSELGDLRKMIAEVNCDEIPKKLKDNRFKAFVAMAPALGLGVLEEKQDVTKPVFIIGAENDKTTPIETNALKYNRLIPHSKFSLLEGKVGHYIFLNEGNNELKKHAKTYYSDDKSVNRLLIHEHLTSAILLFLKENLN